MTSLMRILTKGKKGKHGFTLVELMIVIIIVGILAAVAVPIYSGFVKRAYSSEAKATVGAIRAAEQVYYAEKNEWLMTGTSADILDTLGVDIAQNRWFNDTGCVMSFIGADDATWGVQIMGIVDSTVAGIGAKIIFSTGVLSYTTDGGTKWIETG